MGGEECEKGGGRKEGMKMMEDAFRVFVCERARERTERDEESRES